jgi:hypothetical protein
MSHGDRRSVLPDGRRSQLASVVFEMLRLWCFTRTRTNLFLSARANLLQRRLHEVGCRQRSRRSCLSRRVLCSRRFCCRVCARCHTTIRQDEVILRAKQLIFHLDCFTCVTCHNLLHPGDEFGLRDDLIFCRHHFFDQHHSYESHPTSRTIDMPVDNHSMPPMSAGFLDDSGYYTSPIATLMPSTPPSNTSTPTGTVNNTKRTRKRKERLQAAAAAAAAAAAQQQQQQQQAPPHDEMMSSSDHFLALSPSSSNLGMMPLIRLP